MAGIGFQLKKLFRDEGILVNLKAYGYSTIVTIGPMALCICLIIFSQYLLIAVGTPLVERDRFMAATQYSFIFSQILTGGFNMVISRYVADMTFIKKEENVLASMYGLITICLFFGGILCFLLYFNSPLSISFKLTSYIFFCELIIIWIQCMYVSALKDYMRIVKSFVIGVIVAGVLTWVAIVVLDYNNAVTLFICLDIGFLVIILMFLQNIKRFFRINNLSYFNFLIYIERYPLLLLTGFLYTFGLYAHNFVVWMRSEHQVIVDRTFFIAPFYDVPVFYAYLTILPAMVIFMVSVETSFYDSYKLYYQRILEGFSLQDIMIAKKNMFDIISVELKFLTEVQLFITIASIAAGTQLLPKIGMTSEQIHIFTILVIGNLFFSIMFTCILILLYFDAQKDTVITTILFALSSLVITIITTWVENYGFAWFLSTFICLVLVLKRLKNYLNDIDYYTFCSQPLVNVKKEYKTEQVLSKINPYI
ncbi:exopolysaccharide Pel transporter PelG [Peribacillus acanthi]|uniref:exopolysaccharide Pel transporter PelG n=1 Tax=Peribacillus acanthi TaxID=2171554 RepID=UPI0013006E41|nr:exopolysaccharide Pel transporter PelG [Peribacillus acanthi]